MKRKTKPEPIIRPPLGMPGVKIPEAPPYTEWAGLLLLLHTVLYLVAVYLGQHETWLKNLFSATSLKQTLLSTLVMQGLFIFLPAVSVAWFGKIPPEEITGRKAAPGSLFLSLAAGIPAAVVFLGLNNLFIYLLYRHGVTLPLSSGSSLPAVQDMLHLPRLSLILILLVVTVIPAVVEEFFFRGVLLASLQSGGAVFSAIFWQSVAFSLFHADTLFILSPFLAGLLLAFIRLHCGCLWPAMLTHFSLNVSSIALSFLLPELSESLIRDQAQQAYPLLYASLIAACIAAVALIPILVLLGTQNKVQKKTRRIHFFPGDFKFALALILQIVTMFLLNKN